MTTKKAKRGKGRSTAEREALAHRTAFAALRVRWTSMACLDQLASYIARNLTDAMWRDVDESVPEFTDAERGVVVTEISRRVGAAAKRALDEPGAHQPKAGGTPKAQSGHLRLVPSAGRRGR